jgi:acid phosphatase family membrane protein YuiD
VSDIALFNNSVLITGLIAWWTASSLKLPIEYVRTKKWNWALLFRAGGMPSSHSALVASVTHGIGLTIGFGSPLYALSVALAMIVIYDATGIRRQAGLQAEMINALVRDVIESRHLRPEQLREVLGHSPLEAFVGLLLGIALAQILVPYWST